MIYNDEEAMKKFKLEFFELIENSNILKIKNLIQTSKFKVWELVDEEGNTGLIKACFYDMEELIETLILEVSKKLEADSGEMAIWINMKSDISLNALHYASFRGNIKIIKLLISKGADIRLANENGLNVMHMAAQGNQPNSLFYFQHYHDMKVNSFDNLLSTPLHWAAYADADNAVDYLIAWKADLNLQDKDGLSPLHLAAMTGKLLLTYLLTYLFIYI